MKFSNATIYRFAAAAGLLGLAESLDKLHFVECSPSQEKSTGFLPPRAAEGELAERIGDHYVTKFAIETRTVPGSALRSRLDERCAQIEDQTGRKPGKKEKRDLKEDILHEMLPSAFPKRVAINVWINPGAGLLVLDTTSAANADSVVTALIQSVDGFSVEQFMTAHEPSIAMAGWLHDHEAPVGFTIDRECELKSTDESKSVVRYSKHPLDIDEVRLHIKAGKRPTRLAMTWDDRVSFELTENLTLRKLVFLEGTAEAKDGKDVDNFDADVAIVTGELELVIAAVAESLGGVATFKAELPKEGGAS